MTCICIFLCSLNVQNVQYFNKKIIGYALAKTLKDYYFANIMGMLTEQSDKYNI